MSDYWMITDAGLDVDLLEPDPEKIRVGDVAFGLAQPRYAGQAAWSVAEHSVIVSYLAGLYAKHHRGNEELLPLVENREPPEECCASARLAGLLHDGHEAYVGDTPGPLQGALMQGFTEKTRDAMKVKRALIETNLDSAIWVAICRDVVKKQLPPPTSIDPDLVHIVKMADLDVLLLERQMLWHVPFKGRHGQRQWHPAVEARAVALDWLTSRVAQSQLRRHHEDTYRYMQEIRESSEAAGDRTDLANRWTLALFETLAAYQR